MTLDWARLWEAAYVATRLRYQQASLPDAHSEAAAAICAADDLVRELMAYYQVSAGDAVTLTAGGDNTWIKGME